jgi:ABC-type uncharacterized transport system auxiliary subunit
MIRFSIPILLFGLLAGCASGLVEEQPPAVFFELDYAPPAVTCSHHFDAGVGIVEWNVFGPFDRREMVVEERGRRVRISGGYQWVDRPGRMVTESLIRDLSAGGLFPRVAGAEGGFMLPLELTGRIEKFSWNREGTSPEAVFAVAISLIDRRARTVLFQRTYRLEKPSSDGDDAAAFAQTMSLLVQDFSSRLQHDLCRAAADRGSR